MDKKYHIETLAVQGSYDPKTGEPRVLPICQSTTFKYKTTEELAKLFDLDVAGHFYTRLSNPTNDALEKKMALLEGGIGAISFASGQAATTALVLNLCKSGDHIISSSTIYGGTYNLFSHTLKLLGIEVSFVDQDDDEDKIFSAVRQNTKLLFGESLSNPSVKVLDFEKFSKVAKKANIPFVVDNTFPTPCLCRPFDYGANIVVHSLSKYCDGHATSLGGIIVDKGDFNFDTEKFPLLSEPDDSYHGMIYTKKFGSGAFLVKARTHVMRDTGGVLSPQNAFITNMNLETLPLRMEKHTSNAHIVAEYLLKHEKVAWVNYPGLKNSESYELGKKYLKGCSGVLTFGTKGGAKSAEKFLNSLELVAQVIHVADVRSSVLHPASTTHRQLSAEELIKTGVSPELIRFSVGIENIDDIINDIDNALSKI